MLNVRYRHATKISSVSGPSVLSWRPVFVIMSYLLASPTLDVKQLVADLKVLLEQISRGHVTVLYTNSPKSAPNRGFNGFSEALQDNGFRLDTDDIGTVEIESGTEIKKYELRYALFFATTADQAGVRRQLECVFLRGKIWSSSNSKCTNSLCTSRCSW